MLPDDQSLVRRARFRQKVAVITGAGAGIGRATALAFAREGARIALIGRTMDTLEETAAAVRDAGGTAEPIRADVSKGAEVRESIRHTMTTFGRIDILFNNAGVGSDGKLLCDVEEDVFDAVFAINARGVWLCMKHTIPAMLEGGGGCIVNSASIAGLVGVRYTTPYAGSKHAVIGMTKTAALEYGARGIRINAICPATHESKMSDARRQRLGEAAWTQEVSQQHPATGRVGRLDEITGVVLFLCSPDASNIHGAALAIDGGWSAQ